MAASARTRPRPSRRTRRGSTPRPGGRHRVGGMGVLPALTPPSARTRAVMSIDTTHIDEEAPDAGSDGVVVDYVAGLRDTQRPIYDALRDFGPQTDEEVQ